MDGISGTYLLEYIKDKRLQVPVIIMTAYGTIDSAVNAMRMGASDYIAKPFEYDEILHRAKRAMERAETAREMDKMLQAQKASRENFSMITGESSAIRNIKNQLKKSPLSTCRFSLPAKRERVRIFLQRQFT
jgi:DNA-binding NtrC family response regulator